MLVVCWEELASIKIFCLAAYLAIKRLHLVGLGAEGVVIDMLL